MRADLDNGLAGHYTDISDTVNAREFVVQHADQVDAAGEPGWWLGEHEGYYADGLFRLAWMAGNPTLKAAAIARMQEVLNAQDASGYIGVYPLSKRFTTGDPNDGELWTQSRMFQALLAWYEATGNTRILNAVKKAAKTTLAAFAGKSYFDRRRHAGGGVSHGLGFSDTLEWLYRITGDDTFRTGYLWLYSDYIASNVNETDVFPVYLSDPNRLWYTHTPHVAEALSVPEIAYAYSGASVYAQAADEVLDKLRAPFQSRRRTGRRRSSQRTRRRIRLDVRILLDDGNDRVAESSRAIPRCDDDRGHFRTHRTERRAGRAIAHGSDGGVVSHLRQQAFGDPDAAIFRPSTVFGLASGGGVLLAQFGAAVAVLHRGHVAEGDRRAPDWSRVCTAHRRSTRPSPARTSRSWKRPIFRRRTRSSSR